MSEKKAKLKRKTVEIPVYPLDKQYEILKTYADSIELDINIFAGLIFAETIYTFQEAMINKKIELISLMRSYVEHSVQTEKKLSELRSKVDERKSDNSSY